jgi:hypothetical protein
MVTVFTRVEAGWLSSHSVTDSTADWTIDNSCIV